MNNRKINLNGVVMDIDLSDGKGDMPFGMSGTGSRTVNLDGRILTGCFIENTNMLDGDVWFDIEEIQVVFGRYRNFYVTDSRLKTLIAIHGLEQEQIEDIPEQDRVNTILWGLKYYDIHCIDSGYRFGRELTYRDFCITFDSGCIVAYKSSHSGYIAPNYLSISNDSEYFKQLYTAIVQSINKYFGI